MLLVNLITVKRCSKSTVDLITRLSLVMMTLSGREQRTKKVTTTYRSFYSLLLGSNGHKLMSKYKLISLKMRKRARLGIKPMVPHSDTIKNQQLQLSCLKIISITALLSNRCNILGIILGKIAFYVLGLGVFSGQKYLFWPISVIK